MSLVAEVLPQVVGALQAFDPYERGVALNQLAQVRASSSNAVPGRVQRHITRAQSLALGAARSPRRALPTWRLLPRPAASMHPASALFPHCMRTARIHYTGTGIVCKPERGLVGAPTYDSPIPNPSPNTPHGSWSTPRSTKMPPHWRPTYATREYATHRARTPDHM